jgi:hypothetical protein
MKVLLAGATGAIGIPITRRLLANGHQVLGLTREPAGAGRLEALGAIPVVADALDRDRLLRAVEGAVEGAGAADAVIHELTALRKPPLRHNGMTLTNRLRTQGTANLFAAAEALGARRFLTQSVVFGYGYRDHGPRPLTERDPFGRPAGDSCDPHVAAMLATERQAFSAPEGIALRYGLLYGGDAAQVRALLARRRLPVARGGVLAWSTTRTPPRRPWPPWSTAAPGRPTTSSTTCRPAGRRSTPPWRRRSAPRHPRGSRAGCSGCSLPMWPRSWSAPRCTSPTTRPGPSSAGGPCTRPTGPASGP